MEILMSASQIAALPKAMEHLPKVERLRVRDSEIPGNFTLEVIGFRGRAHGGAALITGDGTIYQYDAEGNRIS